MRTSLLHVSSDFSCTALCERAASSTNRCGARHFVAIATMFLLIASSSAAQTLSPPTGNVLLVVRGAIDTPNVGDEAHFDDVLFATLPQHGFETRTPWDDGTQRFEGVLLKDVLAAAGARSALIDAIGKDDYRASLSDIDLERYAVLLAFRQNGSDLTLRTLGPLRIMFPFDDAPEFYSQSYMAAAVWQLVAMEIK